MTCPFCGTAPCECPPGQGPFESPQIAFGGVDGDEPGRAFLVYAPELQLMEIDPGNPLDEAVFRRWADPYFSDDEIELFVANSAPGDYLTRKDITVLRLGKDFSE